MHTFKQDILPDDLLQLPTYSSYEGDDPKLQHLKGLMIPTLRVQDLVPVGQRENVYVTFPDGLRLQPWKEVAIIEYDEAGNEVHDWAPEEKLPEYSANAMSTGDLAVVGMTDEKLDRLAQSELGERWEPDRPGPSDARRAMYTRVMDKLMG